MPPGLARWRPWPGRLLLAALSLCAVFVLFEAGLRLLASRSRASAPGTERLTIPAEWKRRDVEVAGAHEAYYWHAKLHVFDEQGLRRSTPIPPKRPGVLRVAVFGDSLTYGYGVGAAEAYPSLIEASLSAEHRVEILNLGICGHNSEDVVALALALLPELAPDLVVYGICINDLMPSKVDTYAQRPLSFPWNRVRQLAGLLVDRSLLASFVHARLPGALIALGARPDFYEDILADFDGYQTRFGANVSALNEAARARGLPAVVSLVVHQQMQPEPKLWRLVEIAETHTRRAGMNVVPARGYLVGHEGARMNVSPWEGHPNAAAHRIFADELVARIAQLELLEGYRRGE